MILVEKVGVICGLVARKLLALYAYGRWEFVIFDETIVGDLLVVLQSISLFSKRVRSDETRLKSMTHDNYSWNMFHDF